jgi:hypothetical protein
MVPQPSQTWRGSVSPGGTRSATLEPQLEQKLSGGKGIRARNDTGGWLSSAAFNEPDSFRESLINVMPAKAGIQ